MDDQQAQIMRRFEEMQRQEAEREAAVEIQRKEHKRIMKEKADLTRKRILANAKKLEKIEKLRQQKFEEEQKINAQRRRELQLAEQIEREERYTIFN